MSRSHPIAWSPGAAGPLLALAPDPDEWNWREDAACATVDPDLHFPEKGGSSREAKLVCQACPVTGQCLEWALENNERFGILGGKTERERRRIKREREGAAPVRGNPAGLQALREQRYEAAQERLATGLKRCPKCKTVKSLDDFDRTAGSLDGRVSECKACRSERRRAGEQAA